MRVTHIITRLVIGGAQENTVATVLGLCARPDLKVDLISGPTLGPEGSMESSFATVPGVLTIVPRLVRPVSPWHDLRAAQSLTSLIRARQPDIVHTHSGKAGILGRLAARRAHVPVIIHHIHGPSFGSFQGAIANACFLAAERFAGRLTTHFLCSAEAMTRRYLAVGIGRPEMYTRIFSGFKLEPFFAARNDPGFRAKLGLPPDVFVIGKIGRLSPLKGHDALFSAAPLILNEVPQARFLLLGDGPLRSQLQNRVNSIDLADKVIFAGLVEPAEVAKYLGVMDCVMHLSSREAVSRALPQALAAGKPVVAYDFDGADEVCIDSKTGFLINSGDFTAAAHAVVALARDPSLRKQFGETGRQFVAEHFAVEKMVDTIHQLYARLLSRSPKQGN
jgi:glycosyltransferase involved in cell wall biosynthesis